MIAPERAPLARLAPVGVVVSPERSIVSFRDDLSGEKTPLLGPPGEGALSGACSIGDYGRIRDRRLLAPSNRPRALVPSSGGIRPRC